MPTKSQVTRKPPRKFKIWFEQVNAEIYIASGVSRDKAIAKAKRDWRIDNRYPLVTDVVEVTDAK